MRTEFRHLVITLFTASVLVAGGCGDETTNVNIEQPPGAPGTVANEPTTVTINITEVFKTTPVVIQQNLVDQVVYLVVVNNLKVDHIIVADDGSFNSGVIAPGQTVTIPINQVGEHPFGCGIHPDDPNERGVIRVEASKQPSPTPVPPSPTATPIESPSPTPTPTPSLTPSPIVLPANTIIINAGASTRTTDAFGASSISVEQGATVTVINNDSVDHTVTADNGSFDTGMIEPGETKTFDANEPGDVPFHCTIHPNMRGVLRVQPSASPSPSPTLED